MFLQNSPDLPVFSRFKRIEIFSRGRGEGKRKVAKPFGLATSVVYRRRFM
jgi:hypothetical protein